MQPDVLDHANFRTTIAPHARALSRPGNIVNADHHDREKRPIEKAHLYLLLGAALAVGFLLGYLASAFVPLVRPSLSTSPSISTATAARLSPSEIDASLKAAHASLDAEDLQAAWEKYHQILMANPRHVEALTHLGNLLMRTNRLDDAVTLYDRALGFDPTRGHLEDKPGIIMWIPTSDSLRITRSTT